MENKKEKDRVTTSITISISISEEIYKELSEIAKENGKSVSQVIETVLRNASEAFWLAEYRKRSEKEHSDLLKVGDPLKYGPLRYWFASPLGHDEIEKEKATLKSKIRK